jgi:DNA-binding Lrp family transcriptional regulator
MNAETKIDIETTIFSLIAKMPQSSRELAEELGRTPESINYYLKKLLLQKAIIKIKSYYFPSSFSLKLLKDK